MAYPPVPVYPKKLDDDYTLFLVNNTTESRLCADNSAWADEVSIMAVAADKPELWPSNGFATIDGEMFYYDSVELNADGKVYKLKGCARNLGGTHTKFNPKGTWVRGFVVAEHHNQILNSILRVEEFVGYNFTDNQATLDWRIRHLQALPIIFDDFQCPDVNFTFDIIGNDPQTGILAQYDILVDPPGALNSFRLDFGDGEYTTTDLAGTHRYSLTATIDPVVTIGNDKCQIVITPVVRDNPTEPPPTIPDIFDIPVPEIPPFPDFTFVPCDVPEPEIKLPPIVFPCISIEGQIGPLPSVIIGPDINLVSQVTFTGIDYPINITQSEVRIIGDVNIPSIVYFDVPPTIVIEPPIPPTIVVIASTTTPQSMVMALDWTKMPDLKVDWGEQPSMNVNFQFAKQVRMQSAVDHFGGEFADLFDAQDHVQVEYETPGLPSEIKIVPPVMPKIEIDTSNVPKKIMLEVAEVTLPEIVVNADRVPRVIDINASLVPTSLNIVGGDSIPRQIEVLAPDFPRQIDVVMKNPIPERVYVEVSNPIPDRIVVESDIRVTGFPEYLEVRGIPEFLQLRAPDTMPQVEMVYNGAPIEFKIVMDDGIKPAGDGTQNCVMITPCPR